MRVLAAVAALSVAAATTDDCDPLVPEYCMLPFPNDYFRSNSTGRLAFGERTFPLSNSGEPISPSIGGWNDLDGFSPIPPITTYIPNLEDDSFHRMPFPRLWDIPLSLSPDSATVLLNTQTGGKIAHWTELDHSSDGGALAAVRKRALIIWPAERLNSSVRYVVAIKHGTGDLRLQRSAFFSSLAGGSSSSTGPGSIPSERRVVGRVPIRVATCEQEAWGLQEQRGSCGASTTSTAATS